MRELSHRTARHRRAITGLAIALALVAAACSNSPEADVEVLGAVETIAPASPTVPSTTPLATTAAPPAAPVTTIDYIAQLAEVTDAVDDASFPAADPDQATGVYGYSRYVWTETAAGNVARLLVEGPRGAQTRCQEPALDCSYRDLKTLAEAGGDIAPELGMTADDVASLTSELDQLNAHLASFTSIDQACAAGYRVETEQNANMGIHLSNPALIADGFDPAAPEMLLWAKEGGESIPRNEQGECDDDGNWTGEAGYQVVGAAFLQVMAPEHPEGFTGPIDNWHIHYSSCSGASSDAIQGEEQSCLDAGGVWFERTPVWMMHAYAADGFDSQQGVFAMYNDSVWPLGADLSLAGSRADIPDADGAEAQIVGFDYGQISVDAGSTLTFSNSDGVPHTVTAGSPGAPQGTFDSGILGSGASWTTTFDTAGEYSLFCVLHPQMVATVTVE